VAIVTKPTPLQRLIADLITANQPAAKRHGNHNPLHITYRPPTADSPAILAYGRKGNYPTTSESTAIATALANLNLTAKKRHNAQAEVVRGETWLIARYELPTVGQQSLIPEVQP
jgi:hypothetical protein